MAISLSELTGASTSGNVLNEVNSYADFLDSVPRLVNKADPTGNTDAVQTVATKQPVALPLIDGEGYLFCSGINGNYAQTPDDDSLDITGDFVVDVDVTMKSWSPTYNSSFCGKYITTNDQRSFRFLLRTDKRLQVYISDDGTASGLAGASSPVVPFSDNQRGQVRFSFNSLTGVIQFFTSTDKGVTWAQLGSDTSTGKTSIYSSTTDVYVGAYNHNAEILENAAIHSVKFYDSVTPSSSSLRFNCDFTSPRIPHGATEFECETGQVVTVNTSGNNPAKVIKKSVLRYDGVDDFMNGVLGQTLSSGHLFAAFSVLGDGGGSWVRLFSTNPTGGTDTSGSMFIRRYFVEDAFRVRYDAVGSTIHDGMYDSARGDMLLDVSMTNGAQTSFINNADEENKTLSGTVAVDDFVLAARIEGDFNTPIDLEYLAFFATLSDSQADQVRSFINNRNKVFTLIDSQGYYFFDGAATYDGQVFTGSGSWNGRIVGSDNGDSDFYISQNTLENRPTTDGYKITFADNGDRFDIPQVTLANGHTHAWMVCGTSLGTFAYKVTVSGQTELNLLGHLGSIYTRQAGDLYGSILLPTNATSREIENAKRLLINRGASETPSGSIRNFWRFRTDIVTFKSVDMLSVTFAREGWFGCSSLSQFDVTEIPNSYDFQSAWQGCSSLTQFPQDAKLGTEVTGSVNFQDAWRNSGLTSFSTPLPTATNCPNAWRETELTSFSTELPVCTNLFAAWYNIPELISFNVKSLPLAQDVKYAWYNTNITSFNTDLPKARTLLATWQVCSSLTDFSADVFANWNPDSITNGIFNLTWDGCTSLTAQSVENILVPIANSGKWATSTGLEGGTALSEATIDIDYNVATGSLTAATLSAIETLNGRGWSVNINNQIIVPNILQLQPAAAYSLRSFDSDADPTVVNVRRSSDGALSDFTASQVSDGTLTDWVGGSNLITYSNSFSTNWNKTSSSTLTGGQAGYDGTNDATEFYDSKSNSSYGMYQQFLSLGIDGQITASIYVKAGTVSTGQFDVYYVGGHTVAVSFDLSNGTVEAGILGGSTQIPDAVGIDNVGNGWYRINLTDDNGSTDIQYLRVGLSSAGTIFIQDAQVVYGDAVTPYVETNSSPAGNGYVTTWYDQSGNGNDSTQSTASAQPLIVENGVLVTENGEAALDINKTPLELASTISFNDLTWFTVTKRVDTLNANSIIFDGNSGVSYGGDDVDNGGNPMLRAYTGLIIRNTLGNTSASGGAINQHLSYYNRNGSNASGGLNGEVNTEVTTSSGAFDLIRLFKYTSINDAYDYVGKAQEIVLFDTDQSAQRSGIEKNINDHYSIY